jgi:hypothetical protein
MTVRTSLACVLAALLGLSAACASRQQPEPEIASSTDQFGYAARFPNQMAAARGQLLAHEGESQQITARFSTYVGQLQDPDWPKVLALVERADQAGRSSTYVQRMREVDAVEVFFEEEKEPITRKVGGAAQYAAAQKGCKDTHAYGATKQALQQSIEHQLQERLRAYNEAHLYLEGNEEALGKKNIEKLQTQADEITYASYLVYISAVQVKVRLRGFVEEANAVKSTLDSKIKEAQATLADANATEADKKTAENSQRAATQAREQLDSEVKQAQHVLEGIEERIKQMQQQYAQALTALKQQIEAKQNEQPAAASTQSTPSAAAAP